MSSQVINSTDFLGQKHQQFKPDSNNIGDSNYHRVNDQFFYNDNEIKVPRSNAYHNSGWSVGNNAFYTRKNMEEDDEEPDVTQRPAPMSLSQIECNIGGRKDAADMELNYSIPPTIPIIRPLRRLLEITELPFMILWVYGTFWMTIMSLSAGGVPSNIWYAALIAGFLVGLALNANAYKYIVKPRSRSRSKALKMLETNNNNNVAVVDENINCSNSSFTFSPNNKKRYCCSDSFVTNIADMERGLGDTTTATSTIGSEYNDDNICIQKCFSQKDEEEKRKEEDELTSAKLAKLVLRFPRLFKSRLNNSNTNANNKSNDDNDLIGFSDTTNKPPKECPEPGFMSGLSTSLQMFFPDGIQWSLDYGTMIRFFVIPFGVSSLAGVTGYHRDVYILVFPKDVKNLIISIFVPTVVVSILFIARILALWTLKVKRRWKVVFFNGCLIH